MRILFEINSLSQGGFIAYCSETDEGESWAPNWEPDETIYDNTFPGIKRKISKKLDEIHADHFGNPVKADSTAIVSTDD